MAYIVMAYAAVAYIVMACIGMAYIGMACIGMAYMIMAHIVMAYIAMALSVQPKAADAGQGVRADAGVDGDGDAARMRFEMWPLPFSLPAEPYSEADWELATALQSERRDHNRPRR